MDHYLWQSDSHNPEAMMSEWETLNIHQYGHAPVYGVIAFVLFGISIFVVHKAIYDSPNVRIIYKIRLIYSLN